MQIHGDEILFLCCKHLISSRRSLARRLHASPIQHVVAQPSLGVLVTADCEGLVAVHRMTEVVAGAPLPVSGQLPQGEEDQMWVQVSGRLQRSLIHYDDNAGNYAVAICKRFVPRKLCAAV